MLEYLYGRKHSVPSPEWGFNLVGKKKKYLKAAWKRKGNKYKLETTNRILAVRETKIFSKIPEDVLDFQPLAVLAE